MIDATVLTAETLLEIKNPAAIFTSGNIKELSRRLKGIWHPDRNNNPKAGEVFNHINKLQEAFENPTELSFSTDSGKEYRMAYGVKRLFDFGDLFISRNFLLFKFDETNKDLFDNFNRNLKILNDFGEERYRKQFAAYQPKVILSEKTTIGYVIVLENKSGFIRLSDLLDHQGGKLSSRHVAWVMNSVYNYALYANKIHGLSLIGLSAENIFIDPKNHIAAPWTSLFYSSNDKLIAAPQLLVSLLRDSYFKDKKADEKIDRYAIKQAIGVRCFGGTGYTAASLRKIKVPEQIISFLFDTAFTGKDKNLLTDFGRWNEVLENVFGPKKFVELNVSFDDVYLL